MRKLIRQGVLKALSVLNRNDRGKIVFYHDVHQDIPETSMSTPFAKFLEHVAIARQNGFEFVGCVPSENRTVQVCFDDGFAGLWKCCDKMLEMGVLPTVYIAVDLIGKPHYLDKPQILTLQGQGFTFQSHTWSHRGLTEVPEREWTHELNDSRKWLSDFLQRDVTQLCFPKGLFSRRIYDAALDAGYVQLLSSIPGSVDQGVAPQVLPRNLVQSYSASEYLSILRGGGGACCVNDINYYRYKVIYDALISEIGRMLTAMLKKFGAIHCTPTPFVYTSP